MRKGKGLKRIITFLLAATVVLTSLPIWAAEEKVTIDSAFLGLTQQQRMEDYEYLWKTLKESYPFFGVLKRSGIDADAIYQKYKKEMTNCKDDLDYVDIINRSIYELQGCGHAMMFNPEMYEYFRKIYDEIEDLKAWSNIFNNKKSVESYKKFNEILMEIKASKQKEEKETQENLESVQVNITTDKLVKDKVAYLKINTFDSNQIEEDYTRIMEFYKEIKNYENLVIDLSENGGGSDGYWSRLLVAPNITETLATTNYFLLKDSENNKLFMNSDYKMSDVKDMPKLPKLNQDDLSQMKYYIKNQTKVNPLSKEKAFNGKIWVLVSDKVYSSSETFCMFCKQTGFAKLVGTQTGGDGMGMDPVLIALPNSGLVIRYSMLYSMNYDGSSSEEYGTTPDIISKEGESALDTCLKAIG